MSIQTSTRPVVTGRCDAAHGRAGIVDELAVVALVAEAFDFGAQDDSLDHVALGFIGEAVGFCSSFCQTLR